MAMVSAAIVFLRTHSKVHWSERYRATNDIPFQVYDLSSEILILITKHSNDDVMSQSILSIESCRV